MVHVYSTLREAVSGQVICVVNSSLCAVLNRLFTRQCLTADECSELARKKKEWEDHLAEVLLTKPAEVVTEACRVLEQHDCPVKELNSELYDVVVAFVQVFTTLPLWPMMSSWGMG